MNINEVIIGFIIFGIIIFLLVIFFDSLKKSSKPEWMEISKKKLNEILKSKSEIKYQIIELDKLLEYILKESFNLEKPFGEILKEKRSTFEKIELNNIWTAHKLRNKLVHDISFNGSKSEYSEAKNILIKTIKKYIY
jgi:hypothetical protein